jgi:16S rRNA (uracil1498-N3)-methyltransferase
MAGVSVPRFYAPDLDPDAREVRLPADEGRHLTRVLRLGVGDRVSVFDGRGREVVATVVHAARDHVVLEIAGRVEPAAEPRIPITLAQAVLKPDAMDDVVRDATMMGVTRIAPLITEHVAVKARMLSDVGLRGRWHRVAVASAKQCRRATVPVIGRPARVEEWLREAGEELRVLLVEPTAAAGAERDPRSLAERPRPSSVALLVGPEGGWSAEERNRAVSAGCVPVTLGGLTLRSDAAPIAAITLIRFVLQDL